MDNSGLLSLFIVGASYVIDIAIYFWFAVCLYIIAKKTNTPRPWLAWIPFANIYLMCKVAGKPGWWTAVFCLLLILSIPGAIASVLLPFMALAGELPAWFMPALAVTIVAGLATWALLIIVWMAIAKARNQPSWLGILIIIPIANLVILGILAFSDRPVEQV
jgi:hypothetical protein